ncbi:MAG: hypothetical protein RIG77_01320 [Cyclobacteriaceae bacterium]
MNEIIYNLLSDIDKRLIFFLLCACSFTLGFIVKTSLLSDDFLLANYSNELSLNELNRLIEFQNSWEWLGYLFIPVFYALKFTLIATTLYIGVFFFDLMYSFKKLFQIAMIAEVIFLLPVFIKFLWFTFIQIDFTLEQYVSFYPLSLQNIFFDVPIEPWYLYPLQALNIFEFGYWFVLAAGISLAFKTGFSKSLLLVVRSYIPALVFWITLVVFLSLNFS